MGGTYSQKHSIKHVQRAEKIHQNKIHPVEENMYPYIGMHRANINCSIMVHLEIYPRVNSVEKSTQYRASPKEWKGNKRPRTFKPFLARLIKAARCLLWQAVRPATVDEITLKRWRVGQPHTSLHPCLFKSSYYGTAIMQTTCLSYPWTYQRLRHKLLGYLIHKVWEIETCCIIKALRVILSEIGSRYKHSHVEEPVPASLSSQHHTL